MAERPTAGQLEERALDVTVDGRRIRGRIPFGVESRDLGGWREIIEPTALRGVHLDDLVATVDHAGIPIGRHPRTLEVEERSDGLHWSVEPPASRRDVVEAVDRGDLQGGSWRMRVARDEWRGDVRHIQEIAELRDVAVVTNPAYPAALVEMRNHNPAEAEEDSTMAETAEKTTETATTDTTEERAAPLAACRSRSASPSPTSTAASPTSSAAQGSRARRQRSRSSASRSARSRGPAASQP